MSYNGDGKPPVGVPPPQGYGGGGYPPQGYPPQGYPPHGYPLGYPPQSCPQQAFPPQQGMYALQRQYQQQQQSSGPSFAEGRAYRHHRKRLARIVADQWIHVARYRLITLKFRKKRETTIQRFCITEWRNMVEHRARMSHIFERASVLRRFLLERRSFYTWKKVFNRNRVLAEALRRTIYMVRCKQWLMVLSAFQKHSEAKIMKRKHFVKAESFRNFHVLKVCCSQWSSRVQERLLKLEFNTRARKIWTKHLLQSVLSGWKEAMLLDEFHATDARVAKDPVRQCTVHGFDQVRSPASEDPISQTQIVTKCFWYWYLLVSQKKAAAEHTGQHEDKFLILVVRHYDRNLQRTAYDGWKHFASESQLTKSLSEQSQELDAMEVAVSWFVKALVKRFTCIWKEQVLVLKRYRQNHWYAVVHSKTQYLLKGFHALRENVDAKQSKLSLQELSVNCYHRNLKRKTVSGCKFLHQTKRVKLVQIEHATAQWRAAKLQERFGKWYFATALRSMRRNQQQKSVHFRNRQLLLHAVQAWRDIKGLLKKRENFKMTQVTRLRGSLVKFKKLRILSSWKSLRKVMNIKRFDEARALQTFIGFRTAPVVKALYVHMQEQKLKRSLLAKAANVQNIRLFKFGIRAWSEYVWVKNLSRLAANHRRHRLLKHAMTSLIQWRQPHVEFRNMEEDHGLPKTMGIHRRLRAWNAVSTQRSAPVMPARPQPRRPAFLYDDVAQAHVQGDRNGEEKRSSGGSTSRDPNLVAKEIEWMEQVLLDYEELKLRIVRLRAELALQLEQSSSGGVNDDLDQHDHQIPNRQDKSIFLLQKEITSLEAKKTEQRPLIYAVLSRVQDLQARDIPDT